jgi:glutamine amidotransferase
MFGGDHPLFEQAWAPRELLSGSVNADGWGVAWYGEAGLLRLARAEPVWFDPSLPSLLEAHRAGLVVAALRNATPGIPRSPDGVAPLVMDRYAFVLNGYIPGFRLQHMRALRQPLSDDLYGRLRGASDTETLFLLAVDRIRSGAAPGEALEEVAEVVLDRVRTRGEDRECQLTMVLSDGQVVAGIRTSNRDEVNSLYTLTGKGLAGSGSLLASEALDADPGWTPVPRDRAVVLDPGGSVTPSASVGEG